MQTSVVYRNDRSFPCGPYSLITDGSSMAVQVCDVVSRDRYSDCFFFLPAVLAVLVIDYCHHAPRLHSINVVSVTAEEVERRSNAFTISRLSLALTTATSEVKGLVVKRKKHGRYQRNFYGKPRPDETAALESAAQTWLGQEQ